MTQHQAREQAEWQPIETAPRDGTRFDVWVPSGSGGYRVADLHFNAKGYLTRDGIQAKDLACWPSHWRPLPAPPNATPPAEIAAGTEVARLREALAKVMPIRVHDGRDYAEVYFADGATHSTQAMTMNPDDWRAVQSAWEVLSPAIAADAREGV